MKRALTCALVLWAALGTIPAVQAEPTEFLLRVNKPSNLDRVLKSHRLTLVRQIGWIYLYIVTGPADVSPDDLEAEVRADKYVFTFERDRQAVAGESAAAHPDLRQTSDTLNNALALDRTLIDFYGGQVWSGYANQAAFSHIGVPTAREAGNNGAGYIIAVVDTGVDLTDSRLAGVWAAPGYDFVHNQPGASDAMDIPPSTATVLFQDTCGTVTQSTSALVDQSTSALVDQSTSALVDCQPANLTQSTSALVDENTVTALAAEPPLPNAYGHGTMVSGLIHAVAPGAKILPVKAFNSDGTGRSYDIAQAIYYAVLSGARVINMSFTFTEVSQEVMWATAWAAQQRVVLVGSAGNRGLETRAWPAEHKWVVGTGSTNLYDERSTFSNHGYDTFKIGAPGENLITTYPGGHYASVSGTSFSAAIMSATVALQTQAAPLCEWGCQFDVQFKAPFAPVTGAARVASNNQYPLRVVVPAAVQAAPIYQRDTVKQINNVR
jgi:subtilisin family serine protease